MSQRLTFPSIFAKSPKPQQKNRHHHFAPTDCTKYSSPSPNQTHQNSPQQHQQTSKHPLPPPHHHPAVVTQKVLGQQLNQRRKHQQPRRDGIHRSHEHQPKLGRRAIQLVRRQPNRLAERRRAPVRQRHQPRLQRALGPRDGRDAGAQGHAFKCFCDGRSVSTK